MSMLQTKGLRNYFWGDAIATTVYILNRSSTRAIEMMNPSEAWYEKKPYVTHFQVFRCLDYVHIVDQKRKNWILKASPVFFLGIVSKVRPIDCMILALTTFLSQEM